MNSTDLNKLRKELSGLKDYEVVVYGSYASGAAHSRSDIDLAVISRKNSPLQNKKLWKGLLGKVSEKYDLKIFELLPLDLKASLMNNYLVIFGNNLEISEYFYHFRKLWKDNQHRYEENQFTSVKEKMKALALF